MTSTKTRRVDVAVIGTGRLGLSALSEILRQTSNVVMIDDRLDFPVRDGLQAERELTGSNTGFRNGPAGDAFPQISPQQLVKGRAKFVSANRLSIDDGFQIEAKAIVVTVGDRTRIPDQWSLFASDALTPEDIVSPDRLPDSVAVIGLNPIGLELCLMLHRRGVESYGFDFAPALAGIADPEIAAEAYQILNRAFSVAVGAAIEIQRAGTRYRIAHGHHSVLVDKLLFATTAGSYATGMGWEKIGLQTGANQLPYFDPGTLRVPETRIFIAAEQTGGFADPARAEILGRIAGHNAMSSSYRKVPCRSPATLVRTEPGIFAVGHRWDELDPDFTSVARIRFGKQYPGENWGHPAGIMKLYADRRNRQLLGGSMIGPDYEELAHWLAGYVQDNLTVDVALMMPSSPSFVGNVLRDGLNELKCLLDANRAFVGGPTGPLVQSTAA